MTKLKRYRKMKLGEIRKRDDECLHEGTWHKIAASVGMTVRQEEVGLFRTRRPAPAFYSK